MKNAKSFALRSAYQPFVDALRGMDAKGADELGDRLGVAVGIIDWTASPTALPALGVLATAASRAVQAHLGNRADVVACLASIAEHAGYKGELDRLVQRLRRSDVGYAAAKRRLTAWLRNSFSGQATARANLGSDADILNPTLKRVLRLSVERALSGW